MLASIRAAIKYMLANFKSLPNFDFSRIVPSSGPHLDTNLYRSTLDLQRIYYYLLLRLPPELADFIYADVFSELSLIRRTYSYQKLPRCGHRVEIQDVPSFGRAVFRRPLQRLTIHTLPTNLAPTAKSPTCEAVLTANERLDTPEKRDKTASTDTAETRGQEEYGSDIEFILIEVLVSYHSLRPIVPLFHCLLPTLTYPRIHNASKAFCDFYIKPPPPGPDTKILWNGSYEGVLKHPCSRWCTPDCGRGKGKEKRKICGRQMGLMGQAFSISDCPYRRSFVRLNVNKLIAASKPGEIMVNDAWPHELEDRRWIWGRKRATKEYWGLRKDLREFWVFRESMVRGGGELRVEVSHPALRGIEGVKVHYFFKKEALMGRGSGSVLALEE